MKRAARRDPPGVPRGNAFVKGAWVDSNARPHGGQVIRMGPESRQDLTSIAHGLHDLAWLVIRHGRSFCNWPTVEATVGEGSRGGPRLQGGRLAELRGDILSVTRDYRVSP